MYVLNGHKKMKRKNSGISLSESVNSQLIDIPAIQEKRMSKSSVVDQILGAFLIPDKELREQRLASLRVVLSID